MRKLLGVVPRGESGSDQLLGLAFFAALGLMGYGGWALWHDHFGKPDDKCYWQVRGQHEAQVLVDVPPDNTCVSHSFIADHHVATGEAKDLADFAQKAGRRICGQSVWECSHEK